MKYVIAVGGNALQTGIPKALAQLIVSLHKRGHEILITHGNGVQVGELSVLEEKSISILTAQTQAEIGLSLQTKIADALGRGAMTFEKQKIAVILTRVLVDKHDAEFRNPTKPIGRFYKSTAAARGSKQGLTIAHLINGYRRVVPSPLPLDIMEAKLIAELLRQGYIVIAGGGGGIPMVCESGRMQFVDAVIDKDHTSALMAERIKADRLIILTNVDGAYLNFKNKNQTLIKNIGLKELRGYAKKGKFEKGSMLPKVEACIEFASRTGKKAVIGNLSKPWEAFEGKGTVVTP